MRVLLGLVVLLAAGGGEAGEVRSPREVLGIEVGSDRVLASYDETQRYLRTLADDSPRVRRLELGPTVEGRQMVGLAISTPANLARLDELRRRWARLADPRGVRSGDIEELVATTPVCVLVTAGIHSTEVAGPQSVLLLAHELAAAPAGSPEAVWLEQVVLVLVPSLNPDGHELVVDWYRRHLGTPYEGSSPPFLYHRYAGHDNNRDFVYLNLPETRALNRFLAHDWRPQAHLDLHQMGLQGPRQFVPPFADPIAPLVHPLVWRMTSLLGGLMALRLEEDGRAGVVSGWEFDGAWIGGTRNTGWWKNIFGILTETAGTALATPVHIDGNELRAGGKGLADYRPQLDFPNPWRGGRWGLPEAVAYQRVLVRAFVEFAATCRASLLRDTAVMASEAIRRGERERPQAWVVPPFPADPGRARHLVALLQEAGVQARVARSPLTADGRSFPAGTVVLPAAQPLRQYLLEVLEPQPYPEVRPTAASEPLLPYDITAWSLPLFLGVEVVRVDSRLEGALGDLVGAAFPSSGPPAEERRVEVSASQVAAFAAANRALAAGLMVRRVGDPGAGVPAAFAISGEPREVARVVREAGVEAQAVQGSTPAGQRLRRVRVGVLHPDLGLEDAGWCRLVLERAGFEVEVVDRRRLVSAEGMTALDVLVMPAMEKRILTEGRAGWRPIVAPPPEYMGGVGAAGAEAVRTLLTRGGTVVGAGGSAEWLIETLDLPVAVPTRALARGELACPGSLLRLEVDERSSLGWGLPASLAVLVDEPLGFETRPTGPGHSREVSARFPDGPLLVAGWMRGEEKLRRRAAAVTLSWRGGRVVLLAFSPHFRAQTQAAFPLLLNAVGTGMGDPAEGQAGH
ncbi:MAG: M14 family zinc carboxypeptidase [Thermoanaerobaculaceae bacterium]